MRRLLLALGLVASLVTTPVASGQEVHKHTIRIVELALQYSDPIWEMRRDVRSTLATGSPVVGYTEVYISARRRALRAEAERAGYRVCRTDGGGGLLVRGDVHVLAKGFKAVIPGHGGYAAHAVRGVDWVRIGWHGRVLWISQVHFLTDKAERVSVVKNSALRHAVRVMAGREEARGHIAFVIGDFNDHQGREPGIKGFRSIFADLGRKRPGPIDLRRWRRDNRVGVVDLRLRRAYTDHLVAIATYTIRSSL